MKKAFTLIELMVAVGLLALILSFAGVVFNASIETYRTAAASAEIMRKFRAITDRLDADFEGLRKDGEIFVVWKQKNLNLAPADYNDCDLDGFERLDRIMFFATGDFQSYGTNPMVRGNLARISYMLASKDIAPNIVRAESQPRSQRVLARTQHILTSDTGLPPTLNPNSFSNQQWKNWHNISEYDMMASPDGSLSLEEWKHLPWDQKEDMLAVITDVDVGSSAVLPNFRGAHVDPQNSTTIHMLLCEGVGEFKIQGWYDLQSRWIPEVNPDFFPPGGPKVTEVLYPYRDSPFVAPSPIGYVNINGFSGYPQTSISEANFNNIPGLGRALKFTFTLFDSKGIIERGRTFTHIVYLDK
jgi:prepilin-type N-terminal cleavage/methylation domain-containing protein